MALQMEILIFSVALGTMIFSEALPLHYKKKKWHEKVLAM